MKKKILISFIVAIFLLFTIQACVFADNIDDVISGMEGANDYDSGDAETGIGKALNTVIGFIQYAGSGIAIIVVSILGIKYLFASPTEKADVKKMAVPIIIGCILLFGAVNIAGIIYDFATGAF